MGLFYQEGRAGSGGPCGLMPNLAIAGALRRPHSVKNKMKGYELPIPLCMILGFAGPKDTSSSADL
jgi:hypothetical protein